MAPRTDDRPDAQPWGPVFDAHLHVIDPRFPLIENQGFLPDPFAVPDYLRRVEGLGVVGGAVVSGSFQGLDQTYLRDALARLGPAFVGVTQVPADVPDAEVESLAEAGVRAVRFNLRRGGSADAHELLPLGLRVHALAGWHVELYVDAADLPELEPRVRRLPRVVVDHLGLSQAGVPALLDHVARGGYVKASGLGRLDLDVGDVLTRIERANPEALVFGTDLPSTRAPRAFEDSDLAFVERILGPRAARRALLDNALALYRPG